MTDTERFLWQRLRLDQMGVKFRRQHPFDRYILDFVCLERKLAIELDGSQHVDLPKDISRTQCLLDAGFHVLRFWNHEVFLETDAVLQAIFEALHSVPSNPSPPQPSP